MMYTSQEGELYVSQARALGAVGVVPKTVRPVDVSRVLYQLHLLQDRRQHRSALFQGEAAQAAGSSPAAAPMALAGAEVPAAGGPPGAAAYQPAPSIVAPSAVAMAELQAGLRQSVQQLVKDQLAEQRRFMLATFEAFARRLGGEMKDTVTKLPAPPVFEPVLPPPPPTPWWPVLLTVLLGVIPAAILGALYWKALEQNRDLARELVKRPTVVAAAPTVHAETTAPAAEPMASPPAATPATAAAVEYVPYGQAPLADNRLDRLRTIVAGLEGNGFHGKIVAEAYVGDFCLAGNVTDGFKVAEPLTLASKCDLVGNPFDDALSPAQRQSVDFANFAATLRQRTAGAIEVETVNAGRSNPVEYPEQDENTTAGAWNSVAARNNRVEYRIVPAP
jgi:hypothetical protein